MTEVQSLFPPKHLGSGIVRAWALLSVGSSGPPYLLSSVMQPEVASLVAVSVVEEKGQWHEIEQIWWVACLCCFDFFLLFSSSQPLTLFPPCGREVFITSDLKSCLWVESVCT